MSALDDEIARAKDLFEELGPVTHRKMFGGAALYFEGRIFAVIVDDEVLIKVDVAKAPSLAEALEAEGSTRWSYEKAKDGKPVAMPYWALPEAAYDDPAAAAEWARRSLASTG